ncbi:hypothetical protein [Facklamia sp. P12950]|uniref:hypothetical protein n=1 Tax=Facklamia sp. P12950 TaxID=3421951 RepID=UPI003D17FAB4
MTTENIIGNNAHGFTNEQLLIKSLDSKKYKSLNTHLKKFIQQICIEHGISIRDEMLITSFKAEREIDPFTNSRINVKPDFYIEITNQKFGISTKMGSGNSVHQEKVESFIHWIKNNKNIIIKDESIYNDLRLFTWGDGTLDGSAPVTRDSKSYVIGRYSTKEFKKIYPEKHKLIQEFLNKNSQEIIKRSLFLGKTNNEVHYIYHGTSINGVWISQDAILNFNLTNPLNNSTFNVGRLSFQIYNADKKGTPSGAKKRGDIQLKYGTIENDIQHLMLISTSNIGTYEGNLEEFNFSKMMNRNKKHKFWNYLHSKLNLNKNKYYYIVKVEGQKYSKNAKKKVMCKTDNYIIETEKELDKSFLLRNEYQLTEADLDNIAEYRIVLNSGMSIKQKSSNNFTITKLTVSSFKSAFNNYLNNLEYISATLIFYCTKNQVDKNYKIAQDLNIEESKFIEFIASEYGLNIESLLDYNSLSLATKATKELVTKTIENNKELKRALFAGKGWFDSPYDINFIYSNGQLTDQFYTPYRIDNGSGRSKGIYTIIIKPC